MGRVEGIDLETILARNERPLVYIETGSHFGGRIYAMRRHFVHLVGIELSPEYVQLSRERLHGAGAENDVVIVEGDSADRLEEVLSWFAPEEPAYVHLDAHYCETRGEAPEVPTAARNGFPLWAELAVLRERTEADIVSVDDVHTFGRARPELRASDGDEWEAVTPERIVEELGPRVLDHVIVADSLIVWMDEGG